MHTASFANHILMVEVSSYRIPSHFLELGFCSEMEICLVILAVIAVDGKVFPSTEARYMART